MRPGWAERGNIKGIYTRINRHSGQNWPSDFFAGMRLVMDRRFIYFIVSLAWCFCASFSSAQIVTPDAPDVFDPPDKIYTSDDNEDIDPAIKRSLPVVERHRAFLPVSVDLTSRMPLPGDQGNLGSCTAWATAYAARSYYTSVFEGRDLHESRNLPSPNFVYHLARKRDKGCEGTNFISIVEVLKKGALSLAEYPYTAECVPPPSPQIVAKASDFRVGGYRQVDVNKIDDIKGQLARSNPVLISFATRVSGTPPNAFFRHRGDKTFDDQSIDIRVQDGTKYGWHAMAVVGYDDRRQAFRLLNSWGQKWGDHGYLWMSYDVVPKRIRSAGVLDVAAATRPPSPKPPTPTPVPTPVPSPSPIPVPPPPLPAPLPSPSARLSDLQKLSCAKVTAEVRGGRNILAGFVSSSADLDFVKQVALSVPNTLVSDVAVAPWPQCEALQTLEKPLAASDQPKILIGPTDLFRNGDTLRIEIQLPSQISYLYVSYIQADGSVVHLAQPKGIVPQPTLPNSNLVFGDGMDGRAKFTVSPPFGREMIIALASRSPIFEEELPPMQTEREFLTALRRALIYKPSPGLPDREVATAIKMLQTR